MKTITFRSVTQAMLFEAEIKGQISDGMWENCSNSCWEIWCDATPVVGDDIGRDFYVGKTGFGLHALVPVIGDQMIKYAKLALAFSHVSDFDELRLLEYAGDKIMNRVDCSSGFWMTVAETIERHGGHDTITAAVADVNYDETALRRDLSEMKKALKVSK